MADQKKLSFADLKQGMAIQAYYHEWENALVQVAFPNACKVQFSDGGSVVIFGEDHIRPIPEAALLKWAVEILEGIAYAEGESIPIINAFLAEVKGGDDE